MPIAVNCLQGRKTLPKRAWTLPSWFGWTADIISLVYISLTTVLFLFPPNLPVTGSNMSKCRISQLVSFYSSIQTFPAIRLQFAVARGSLFVCHAAGCSSAAIVAKSISKCCCAISIRLFFFHRHIYTSTVTNILSPSIRLLHRRLRHHRPRLRLSMGRRRSQKLYRSPR